MPSILQGRRPDITAAQIAAVLVGGVPAIATLLTSFGVGDASAAQQDARSGALTWSVVLAGVHVGGDATQRSARNLADARTDAAAMAVGEVSPTTSEDDLHDHEADFEEEEGASVTDEEEFFAESELQRLEAGLVAENPDYVGSDGR
jgi:hypothetical protein